MLAWAMGQSACIMIACKGAPAPHALASRAPAVAIAVPGHEVLGQHGEGAAEWSLGWR